jgi:hypothetical protein
MNKLHMAEATPPQYFPVASNAAFSCATVVVLVIGKVKLSAGVPLTVMANDVAGGPLIVKAAAVPVPVY